MDIGVVVAVAALGVSLITLYVSHLRNAGLRIFAGDTLDVWHFEEGNVSLSLPVTCVNSGARMGVVRRVALLVESSHFAGGYLLEPLFYQRVTEEREFVPESAASIIAIGGKSYITKQIQFRSSFDRPTEFQLTRAGEYKLTLIAWAEDLIRPTATERFSIRVSAEAASRLAARLASDETDTETFVTSRWEQWSPHFVTNVEIGAMKLPAA